MRRVLALVVGVFLLWGPVARASEAINTSWPSYNGSSDGQRFADIDQITPGNVATLDERCRVKVAAQGALQSGLVLVDGLIFLSTATDTLAVDASNCAIRWRHQHKIRQSPVHLVNRGVAHSNGRVFRGTPDARLLALDSKTGRLLWEHQIGDPGQGEFLSAAPQVFQGLVIIGTAGGKWGAVGRVMAYDFEDGQQVWRFNTLASGDEPGANSWSAEEKSRSGGTSWASYSLDMSAGELFVPVGNPSPELPMKQKIGQKLYSNTVVVLDAATGKLKRHYPLPPSSAHDLDVAAAPMLYSSQARAPMLAVGSKDGHLYGIDRISGEQVFRTPITRIKEKSVPFRKNGEVICPGPFGGVAWNGPALDRINRQIIVGATDWCATLKKESGPVYEQGSYNLGATWKFYDAAKGWLVGLDSDTGEILWKYRTQGAQVAGVTPTSGNLTFSGDMVGYLYAIESSTGREVFRKHTGGAVAGGVITYLQDARQYIAITSGNHSPGTFGKDGSSGQPSLVIYGLGGKTPPPPKPGSLAYQLANRPPDAQRGKALYAQHCGSCHGSTGQGGAPSSPRLRGLGKRMSIDKIEDWIRRPSGEMPKLFPAPLDSRAVRDIASHVRGL